MSMSGHGPRGAIPEADPSFSFFLVFCVCRLPPGPALTMPGAHSKENAATRKKAQLRLLNLHMISNICAVALYVLVPHHPLASLSRTIRPAW